MNKIRFNRKKFKNQTNDLVEQDNKELKKKNAIESINIRLDQAE